MPLMNVAPASTSSMKRACSAASFVQAAEPSPKSESFASAIASSRSFTRKSSATGPNTSSRYAGALGGMSASSVGG